MLIGVIRCGDKCENTVLLETQGPCGSVRKCGADTVTDDTCAQVKDVTPVTLGVTFAGCKKIVSRSEGLRTCGGRERRKHQSADFTFQVLDNFTGTKSDSSSVASGSSSSIEILRPFLLFLRRSLHSLFLAFMARLSSVGLKSKTPVLNVSFNRPEVIVFVKQSDSIADVSIQPR